MERNFTDLDRLFSFLCSIPSARITFHERLVMIMVLMLIIGMVVMQL